MVIVAHKIRVARDESIDLPSCRRYSGSLPDIPSVLILGGLERHVLLFSDKSSLVGIIESFILVMGRSAA
jgi:hypothetical protein